MKKSSKLAKAPTDKQVFKSCRLAPAQLFPVQLPVVCPVIEPYCNVSNASSFWCNFIVAVLVIDAAFRSECLGCFALQVYKARNKDTNSVVALKKIRVHSENFGVSTSGSSSLLSFIVNQLYWTCGFHSNANTRYRPQISLLVGWLHCVSLWLFSVIVLVLTKHKIAYEPLAKLWKYLSIHHNVAMNERGSIPRFASA